MLVSHILAAVLSVSTAELVAPDAAPDGQAVHLWCARDEPGHYSRRYANLVSMTGIDGEVALTAGHGLHQNQVCELRSGQQSVSAIVYSIGAQGAPASDWAVIRSDSRFTQAVERFSIAMTAATNFTAMLKLNSQVSPLCQVFSAPEEYWWPDSVLLHDCLSLPGRSGAPILAAENDDVFLVGLNLGSLVNHQSRSGQLGYLRRVDEEIADALLLAARATSSPP
jgi:hypothetical protein